MRSKHESFFKHWQTLKNANVLKSRTCKNPTTALYSETTKLKNLKRSVKIAKMTKRSHTDKGCASTCNVEILNFFNHEIQLTDTEFAIRIKLIDLLIELKGSNIVTT